MIKIIENSLLNWINQAIFTLMSNSGGRCVKMKIKRYGNERGPLLVFLHGGGVGSWMWKKQIDYFKEYDVVTVDLPEHGENRHIKPFSIKSSAHEISSSIKKLANNKKVNVVGFSLGAQVLVEMLSKGIARIDYAIIISALVTPSKLIKWMIKPSVLMSSPLMKSRLFARIQARALFIGETMFDAYFQETKLMEAASLIRILEENMSYTLPEGYHQSRANILVVVGEKERRMMRQSAKQLIEIHPNSEGLIVKEIAHGWPLIEPENCNQAIERFIEQKPSKRKLE